MKNCDVCDSKILSNSKRQIYCSRKCCAKANHRKKRGLNVKNNFYICAVCDKNFLQKRANHTEYCGVRCKRLGVCRKRKGLVVKGPLKHIKGSGHINSNGYKVISKNHPNAKMRSPRTGKGQILEHVWIMSNHLDRPLKDTETVHHKNGIRHDNRLENLELWSHSHPYGQRVEDKIQWCKEFLAEYGYKVIMESNN